MNYFLTVELNKFNPSMFIKQLSRIMIIQYLIFIATKLRSEFFDDFSKKISIIQKL